MIIFFLFVVSAVGAVAWMSRDLPSPDHLMDRDIAQSTKIYDRTGEHLLYDIHGQQQRTLMELEEIPDHVKHAAIAMEDKNFYKHPGFSIWAIFRTAITDIVYGKMAGASTITQQLVKNAVLSPEKTFSRKAKELILAYQIEQKYSKDEILQMYLNEIPYGGATYGVEAASHHYFGKSVQDISLAEAATLAALPQAPSFYSPHGPNKELLLQRKNYILKLMEEQGYISEEEKEEAQQEELTFKKPASNIKAPHFVMYIKSVLSQKYGERMIEQGGLKIRTSLDMHKQKMAEEVVKEKAEANQERYDATNAGLVSIDPKTGQILAMVGSRDYFSKEVEGEFNIATAKRQPGSSFKPIVYSSLFKKGFTPQTQLFDVVTNFSDDSDNPYEPKNYDLKEHGLISIRKALAGSLNIPAVKAMYLSGKDDVFELTESLGYSTFEDEDRFGLSLVLGGGEVKLLEHTNAYSAFARDGLIRPISPILKMEDSQGDTIEEYKDKEKRVLESKEARMINSVLSDNEAREFAYGRDNSLTLDDRQVAAKTGTTNNYRDAWTVGYTPSLVTGVWVGNNDYSQMKKGASGGNVAAPIWNQYMQRVLGDTPKEKFTELEDVETGKDAIDGKLDFKETVEIDKASDLLATEHTPQDYIQEKTYTTDPHSILYYVDKEDPLGSAPEDPSQDPQFDNWEEAVERYARESEEYSTSSTSSIPTEYDDVHKPEYKPDLEIVSPEDKELIETTELNAEVDISASRGVDKVSYYINEQLLEEVESYPFNLSKEIDFLSNGYHELKVEVCDDVGNCSDKTILFNLKVDDNSVNGQTPEVSWVRPDNGTAFNSSDFPINLQAEISGLENISQVEVLSKPMSTSSSSSDETVIHSEDSSISNRLMFDWSPENKESSYELMIKVETWEGVSKESEPLLINIDEE